MGGFYGLGREGVGHSVTVSFPDSIEEISSDGFRLCHQLRISHWPTKLKKLGDNAFYQGKKINSLPDSENLEHLGVSCLASCVEIRKSGETTSNIIEWVKNARKLTYVGSMAFDSDPKLTGTIDISKTNLEIFGRSINLASNAFSKTGVKRGGVFNLAGRTEITANEFKAWSVFFDIDGVTELSTLNIPEGITNIADSAFANTSSIDEVILPASLKTLGTSAFSTCSAKKFTFKGNKVTIFPASCFWNSSIRSMNSDQNKLIFPSSLTSIRARLLWLLRGSY